MNILEIGGTRFLGKRLGELMLKEGHEVTIISRHPENAPEGAEVIGLERRDGVDKVSGRKFDLVIDLIGYDEPGPSQVFEELKFGSYLLVSSTWLTRLGTNIEVDEEVTPKLVTGADRLPGGVREYLFKKLAAETAVLGQSRIERNAAVLRLPVMWGVGDHTRRLEFYLQRIGDKFPLICVNGGNNLAQVVWMEDIARAIIIWIKRGITNTNRIWEGLPDSGIKVKKIMENIANAMRLKLNTVDVPAELLADELPEYLEAEPLWRLSGVRVSENNIFRFLNICPTPQRKWMGQVAVQSQFDKIDETSRQLRDREIIFLRRVGYTLVK